MTAILTDDRILGGTVLEIEHPAGMLRFEEFRKGEWLTLKGEPAKKDRRGYFLNGEEIPFSVSGIVGTLDKPALRRWYEDRGVRGGVRAERMGELEGVPEEDWAARVRFLDLGADTERDEAADRGDATHAVLHTLATTGQPPEDYPPAWLPYYQGAMRAWLALDPKVIAAEFLVCHPEMGYAGRVDLLAIIDGAVTLLDYKSSLKGVIYPEAHWQTRGYAEATPLAGLPTPERVIAIAIGGDGGFSVEDCAVEPDEWAALVTVTHTQRRVKERQAAARKALKAAA